MFLASSSRSNASTADTPKVDKFTVLAAAVALSVGLAACGGGGSSGTAMDDDGMETPDPAIAQRADINMKITAARTAVAGVNDESTDSEVGAADNAVMAASTAVTGASAIDDNEKAAFNTAIAAIQGDLDARKTSRTTAMNKADEQKRKDMAALGKALHAALGGPTAGGNALANIDTATTPVSLSSEGLVIDAAAGAGALTTNPDSETLEAGASAGALGSWSGMDYAHSEGTGDAKVTNEARVYTNQGAPMSVAFADSGHTLTDGSLAVNTTAEYALVMAAAFTHSGMRTHATPERADAVYVRGTYDGAPGEYSCPTQPCTSINSGSGAPSELTGWSFTPDKGAMVSQPDDEYLYYGWWVSKNSDGNPTAASAFAGVVEPTANDLDRGGDLSTLTGSAKYVGHAAGKFAMSNVLDGTGNGGHFTADAELQAKFSGTNRGVTGTIDNFRLNDGSEDPGWSVSLASGGLGSAGAITAPADDTGTTDVDEGLGTVWSINDNPAPASGTWSGTMYDELPGNTDDDPAGDGSNIPTTVTGTFYSEFSTIGRMVGAFGANHVE